MGRSCDEIQGLFHELVTKTLEPNVHVNVASHLQACATCREELRIVIEIRRTIQSNFDCAPTEQFVRLAWQKIYNEISDCSNSTVFNSLEIHSLLSVISDPFIRARRVLRLAQHAFIQVNSNAILSLKSAIES